jgi:hypothetical protein
VSGTPTRIVVRGGADAEDIAAVIAVLGSSGAAPGEDAYRRWRLQRAEALRRSSGRPSEVFARR